MKKLIVLIVLIFGQLPSYSLPAFPGAEGMGASTIGGRNASATVYIVDTLSDNPADGVTFREAVTASGPRYVVFKVSGVIMLTSDLTIDDDYLTIAGQTSPGGICIAGYTVIFEGVHDVIITHMRFRTGPLHESGDYDCIQINGGSSLGAVYGSGPAGTDPSYNIIFDHCSFSWSNDEIVNCNLDYYNIVFSWCIFTEPLYNAGHSEGDHNLGLFFWGRYNSMSAPTYGVSVHHSFLSESAYRVPELNYNGFIDLVNCVAYNADSRWAPAFEPDTDGTQKLAYANIIGNYNKTSGPQSINDSTVKNAIFDYQYYSGSAYQAIYMTGNVDSYHGASTPSWNIGNFSDGYGEGMLSTSWQKATPFSTGDIAVTATTMDSTYASYIVAHSGANRIQNTSNETYDSVDSGAQTRYTNNTGAYKNANTITSISNYPSYTSYTPPTDSDNDGMADSWETSTFGGTSYTAIQDNDSDGYSNLEEYLHYLGDYGDEEEPPAATATFSGMTRSGVTRN